MSWDFLAPVLGAAGAVAGSFVGMPTIGATLGGSLGSMLANSSASSEAAKSQQAAAQQQAEGIRQQQAKLGQLEEANAPGQSYLRKVVAGSAELTPEQRKQLEDQRLAIGNQIRGSSIAGSGRTAASLLRDTENRFTLGALAQNRQRADTAASGMANRGFQAGSGIASGYSEMGKAYGTGTANAGLVKAAGTLANGQLMGSAFGNIASTVNRTNKSRLYGDGESGNYGGSPETNPSLNPATYGNVSASW